MVCTSVASSSESDAPKDRYVQVLTKLQQVDKHEDSVMTKFIVIIDELYKELNKEIKEHGWEAIPAYIHDAHKALQVKKKEFLVKRVPLMETGMCDVAAYEADLSEVKDAAMELLRRFASFEKRPGESEGKGQGQ